VSSVQSAQTKKRTSNAVVDNSTQFQTQLCGVHNDNDIYAPIQQICNQTWGNRQSWSITIHCTYLSNRNRLNWPKMTRNRNWLHSKFNSNRRWLSRFNWKIFTLHHCTMNRGCIWVSSFIIVSWIMFQGWPLACLCALNPDSPAASTAFPANSRFVPAMLCWPPDVT